MLTSATAGLQAMGFGGSAGGGYTMRDPKEEIGEGELTPWPKDVTSKFIDPPPEGVKLDTRVVKWLLHLVVFREGSGTPEVLVDFECKAGRHVILLEGITLKRVKNAKIKSRVHEALGH